MSSHRLWESYQKARTTYVNAINSSRTSHFTDMMSSAGNDAKKLFGIVNTLCNKSRDNPLPEHVSGHDLVNAFGQFLQDKISKIQRAIGPSEPPHMQHRDGSQLQCLSPLSEEQVHKLVSAFKTTSCSLDPLPTRLLKEHLEDILPHVDTFN